MLICHAKSDHGIAQEELLSTRAVLTLKVGPSVVKADEAVSIDCCSEPLAVAVLALPILSVNVRTIPAEVVYVVDDGVPELLREVSESSARVKE